MLLMQVSKCWKIAKFPKFQLKWKVSKHFTRPKQRVTVRKLLSPHRRNASYSSAILEKNICRLFHVSAQFLFTTSEMKLDYYQQKVNVRVVSRVVESPEQQILGNFEKIPEMLGMMASTQPTIHKPNFDIRAKISRKSSVNHCIVKYVVSNFWSCLKSFVRDCGTKIFLRRYTKIYRHSLSKHSENVLPGRLEMVQCQSLYLTPTRNMLAGKLVKWLRPLPVLREYIFYNVEWVEVRKISKGFWAKLYCKMIDIFF